MATKLVYAYSTRTGKKLAHQVPEEWFDHPELGKGLSRTPRQKAADKKAARSGPAATHTTETPAAGDDKE